MTNNDPAGEHLTDPFAYRVWFEKIALAALAWHDARRDVLALIAAMNKDEHHSCVSPTLWRAVGDDFLAARAQFEQCAAELDKVTGEYLAWQRAQAEGDMWGSKDIAHPRKDPP